MKIPKIEWKKGMFGIETGVIAGRHLITIDISTIYFNIGSNPSKHTLKKLNGDELKRKSAEILGRWLEKIEYEET